jgi:hypothetical protein
LLSLSLQESQSDLSPQTHQAAEGGGVKGSQGHLEGWSGGRFPGCPSHVWPCSHRRPRGRWAQAPLSPVRGRHKVKSHRGAAGRGQGGGAELPPCHGLHGSGSFLPSRRSPLPQVPALSLLSTPLPEPLSILTPLLDPFSETHTPCPPTKDPGWSRPGALGPLFSPQITNQRPHIPMKPPNQSVPSAPSPSRAPMGRWEEPTPGRPAGSPFQI